MTSSTTRRLLLANNATTQQRQQRTAIVLFTKPNQNQNQTGQTTNEEWTNEWSFVFRLS